MEEGDVANFVFNGLGLSLVEQTLYRPMTDLQIPQQYSGLFQAEARNKIAVHFALTGRRYSKACLQGMFAQNVEYPTCLCSP